MHSEPSPLAGKTARLRTDAKHFQVPCFGGSAFRVEDWWDRVYGKDWRESNGNPAACVYGFRVGSQGLPMDGEVLYGHIDGLGHLVHVSELMCGGVAEPSNGDAEEPK